MTRITPLFVNDQIYFADELRSLLGGLTPHGGSWGHRPGIISNNQIQMTPGVSYVRESVIPASACASDTAETVQLNVALPSNQSRWDLVVCQPRPTTKDWVFTVVQGTATTGTPAVPATPAGTLPICRQRILGSAPLSAGVWTNPNLVDLRRPPLPLEHIRSFWMQGGSNIDITLPGGVSQNIHPSFVAPYEKVYGQGTKLVVTMHVSGAWVNTSVLQGIWHSLEFTHGTGIGGAPIRTVVPAGGGEGGGSGTFELTNIPYGTYTIVPSVRSDQGCTVRYYG